MEPVPGSTSGHTQVDYMNTILYQPIVHAMVVEYLLQVLWTLTTTVRQQLVLVAGSLLFSTLMTYFGMDKIVVELSVHAVILQTFRGSAKSFLS